DATGGARAHRARDLWPERGSASVRRLERDLFRMTRPGASCLNQYSRNPVSSKRARGAADLAAEGPNEIGQVAPPGLVGDFRDREPRVAQQRDRADEAHPEQVLVRREPDGAPERPQEVEGAETDLPGNGGERNGIGRMALDVPGGRHRSIAL